MAKKTLLGLALAMVFSLIQISLVHAIDAGMNVGTAYYRWREFSSLGVLKEMGNLRTIDGYLTGAPLQELPGLRLRSGVSLFLGQVDYDTKTSGGTPVKTTSNYLGFKVEEIVELCIVFQEGCLGPFLGVAYRWWERDIDTTSIAQGYPEVYSTLYAKIGLRVDHRPSEDFLIYTAWSIDPMLWATERINWSSISGEKLKVTNGRRAGWTIEGGAQWKHLEAVAYWQATRLGKSNEISCLGGAATCSQPRSIQDLVGFKLGVLF